MGHFIVRLILVAALLGLAACSSTPTRSYAMLQAKNLRFDEGLKDIRLTESQRRDFEAYRAQSTMRDMERVTTGVFAGTQLATAVAQGGLSWTALGTGPLALVSLLDLAFPEPLAASGSIIAVSAPVSQYKNIDEFERATVAKMQNLVMRTLREDGWSVHMADHKKPSDPRYSYEPTRWERLRYQTAQMSKPGECDACTGVSFLFSYNGGKEILRGYKYNRFTATFRDENGNKEKRYVKVGQFMLRHHPVFEKKYDDAEAYTASQKWYADFYAQLAANASDDVVVYVPSLKNIGNMPVVYHKGQAHYFIKPEKKR